MAIIGAGIGGLTLANALERHAIPFEIFERDASPDARTQGYALGLTEPGGLTALKHFGLYDAAMAAGRPATDFAFVTHNGRLLMHLSAAKPGARGYTLGVPRTQLRTFLIEGLRTKPWFSKQCVGYKVGNAGVAARFDDGSEYEADVVIACDGVNSAVRKQMLGDAPRFLGICSVGATIQSAVEHPLLLGNSLMMLGPGSSVFVQRFGKDNTITWSLTLHANEDAFRQMTDTEVKELAIKTTKGWSSPIPELIAATPSDRLRSRPLYDRDPPKAAVAGPVALLGDACHPMSPFRGQGANTAMLDALDLADCLAVIKDGKAALALPKYNAAVLARCKRHILQSRRAALTFHTQNPFRRQIRNVSYLAINMMLQAAQRRETSG